MSADAVTMPRLGNGRCQTLLTDLTSSISGSATSWGVPRAASAPLNLLKSLSLPAPIASIPMIYTRYFGQGSDHFSSSRLTTSSWLSPAFSVEDTYHPPEATTCGFNTRVESNRRIQEICSTWVSGLGYKAKSFKRRIQFAMK